MSLKDGGGKLSDDVAATEELATARAQLFLLTGELKRSYQRTGDLRLMRMQLIVEEVAEIADALAKRDEVELLDALADTTYVVVGTACTYDMPLAEAFVEVHRSNMTKQMKNDDHAHGRKGKGETFSPPDLAGVLRNHKEGK